MPTRKTPADAKQKRLAQVAKNSDLKSTAKKTRSTNGNHEAVSQFANASTGVSKGEIEARAREIWQNEGCPSGRELEHWLRAEKELSRS